MGQRGEGYVQGWAFRKDAGCEKIVYGEISEWGIPQVNGNVKKVQMPKCKCQRNVKVQNVSSFDMKASFEL
jgi:hypothetical protein